MIINQTSPSRGTIGVNHLPDDHDSGYCHLRHNAIGVVRVNLDGVWTNLCAEHRDALRGFLDRPRGVNDGSVEAPDGP